LKIDKPCIIVRQNETVEVVETTQEFVEGDETTKPLFNIVQNGEGKS